jgi:hypothetical protein
VSTTYIMTTTYRIERRDVNGAWIQVWLDFRGLDAVKLEYKSMLSKNPEYELRIVKAVETVIERTL